MLLRAIVLAAGYGTRLKPLTDSTPKPLLPFRGVPILDIALKRLFDAGVEMAAVNAHHLAERIKGRLETSPWRDRTKLYVEREILGTGGPLVNARDSLSDCDCFILHNGDIVCDFDLRALAERHVEAGNVATLCLLDGPENKVLAADSKILDILGRLNAPQTPGSALLTYAGVAAFSPKILGLLPERPQFCSIIDAILKAIAEDPGSVGAFVPENPFWSDIGSFEQYFRAHERALARTDSQFVFAEGCEISPEAELSGFVAASANCRIAPHASVSNCILLEGASVAEGESWRNAVLSPAASFHRETPLLLSLKTLASVRKPWTASSLPEQGSDRRFIRVTGADGRRGILMLSSERDQDFDRYIQIGSFMHANKLYTPEIFACDKAEFAVFMEDLGDSTIFNLMRNDPARAESLYSMVVDSLADFQLRGTAALDATPGLQLRTFDYEYLRWETSYFKENFLELLCGLSLSEAQGKALMDEFHTLATLVRGQPQTLMHRDFQSQNILLKDGSPRYVDFQGARLGPFAYDLASLLKDPYVSIPGDVRERLAERHFQRLSSDPSFAGMGFDKFRDCLLLASLQRNMQALGAYGFLSMKKRKAKYLDFAEPCLKLLVEGVEGACSAPAASFRPRTLETLCNQALQGLSSRLASARESIVKP